MKEDLEPLLTQPTPHVHSCFSTDPVQNATWEATAPAEPQGGWEGSGQEGLGDPSPRQLEAEPPDHSASLRKPPRESEADQRAQADRRWRPATTLTQWRRLHGDYGGCRWVQLLESQQTRPPSSPIQYSLQIYRPLCLKRSFRTCTPDTYGQSLCAGSGSSSFALSGSKGG